MKMHILQDRNISVLKKIKRWHHYYFEVEMLSTKLSCNKKTTIQEVIDHHLQN